MARAVILDENKRRFLVREEEHECVLEYRREGPATVEYFHTYVPPHLRGKGIAAELAEAALNYAKNHQLFVIPSCSYVAAFIARHPEFKILIA